MLGPGLKSQITITLALLLGVAMLLANIVIVFFWQHSIIQSEANRLVTTLQILSQNHQSLIPLRGQLTPVVLYEQVAETLDPACISIQLPDRRKLIADGACPHTGELDANINRTIQSGTPSAKTFGSTWAVFTFRPEYLVVTVPIQGNSFTGGLGIVSSLQPIYSTLRQKQKIILVYIMVNLIFLTIIGFFRLVKSTVKPVERLVRMTEEYDESRNFPLFSSRDGNEFGQLTAALNSMTQRLENDRRRLRETVHSLESANKQLQQTQNEMVKAEKLAAIGRLSAGLAHEIGNPIGIIQGYLELLQKESLTPEDRKQFSIRAIEELSRINRLIRQLLDFARSAPTESKMVRVNHLIQDVVELFKARRNMDSISFYLRLNAREDGVIADREGLRQVFLNCLINAVDAIGENVPDSKGKIYITTDEDTSPASAAAAITVTITDNGSGIDPALLDTIFDPFFTTKEPGKGTGLGLSVSHTIIETAGGSLAVDSTVGEGTEVKITLPLASRPGATEPNTIIKNQENNVQDP